MARAQVNSTCREIAPTRRSCLRDWNAADFRSHFPTASLVQFARSISWMLSAAAGERLRPQTTLIQTTTPISPGNSGGPLINASGEVVGVKFLSRIDAQNLNFAIAANEVSEVLS